MRTHPLETPPHIRDLLNEVAYLERRLCEADDALVSLSSTATEPRSYVELRAAATECVRDLRMRSTDARRDLERVNAELHTEMVGADP